MTKLIPASSNLVSFSLICNTFFVILFPHYCPFLKSGEKSLHLSTYSNHNQETKFIVVPQEVKKPQATCRKIHTWPQPMKKWRAWSVCCSSLSINAESNQQADQKDTPAIWLVVSVLKPLVQILGRKRSFIGLNMNQMFDSGSFWGFPKVIFEFRAWSDWRNIAISSLEGGISFTDVQP